MKAAVIYFSYDGNCAMLADLVGTGLKADVFRLKLVDEKRRKGFLKILWGGAMTVRGKRPPLKPYSINFDQYDIIAIGCPVWAGSPAAPLSTFLDAEASKIKGKKLALFTAHHGGKGKFFDKLKAALPGNTIAGEIDFLAPLEQDAAEVGAKIASWVKTL
jgi:flavodoxin